MTSTRSLHTWISFILAAIFACLFAYLNLSEYVEVGILNNTAGYPFGGEGPTPWYYRTKELYATAALVFGSLFSILLLLAILAFIKKRSTGFLIACLSIYALIILQLVVGI